MKIKKIILITLTTILLASLFVVSVAAAGNAVATTDGKDCAKGETVTLDVNVSEVYNVYSGAIEVEYDSNVLEFVDAKWNTDDVLKDVSLKNYDTEKNKGAFSFNSEHNISGKIFSITFKVLDNAAVGKSTVKCNIQLKTTTETISVTNNAGFVNVLCDHSFDTQTNTEEHWNQCSICGAKTDVEAHEWVEGKCAHCETEQPKSPEVEDTDEPKDDTKVDGMASILAFLSSFIFDPTMLLLLVALLMILFLFILLVKDEFF